MNTNNANFNNITGVADITLTDNGGSGTEVDFGTLADVVDNSQTNFKNTVTFKFQAGDTIDIDNSTELGKFVTDIGSSALTLTDQAVTVSGTTLSVTQARSIAADTTGTVTGSIDTASRVSALTTLYNPGGGNETNAWTIVISNADKTSSAADLNTINASTSVEVNAAQVTGISSSAIADVGTLMTNAVKDGDPDAREFTACLLYTSDAADES